MIVGLAILIASTSLLLYRHSLMSWSFPWRYPNTAAPQHGDDKSSAKGAAAGQEEVLSSWQNNNGKEKSVQDGDVVSDQDEIAEAETTPKARPTPNAPAVDIPRFSLEAADSEEDTTSKSEMSPPPLPSSRPPPLFPALNSAQRASSGPSPRGLPTLKPVTNHAQRTTSQLMPPPSRFSSASPSAPSTVASLRVPSTGPLPNRGPPSARSLALSSTAPIKTANPRQKVTLKPGHSPLDWANLQKSGQNLSGVGTLQRVTPSQLKQHNGRKGRPAWSSYQGKVYNITPYLPYHPGGEGELMRAAGKDGGKLFMEVHSWVNWENMLGECLVGIMVGEMDGGGGGLEEMD